jgi:hypothetical protein
MFCRRFIFRLDSAKVARHAALDDETHLQNGASAGVEGARALIERKIA